MFLFSRKSTGGEKLDGVDLRLGTEWLPLLTRFRVIVDMIKPEKLEVTTTLKTLDYIEVPASTKKDHKLTFFSYKEGMYTAKVKSPTCVCDPSSFSGFFLTRSISV